MKIDVWTHPACLAHDPGAGHPESPARLRAVLDGVAEASVPTTVRAAPRADRAELERVHAPRLLDQLERLHDVSTRVPLDPDTAVGPQSVEAAWRAAGAGIAAVDAVLSGASRRGFCAVRPPGHHATREVAMGFCLINSIAVAAAHALYRGLDRVAIVDFDVHHGNGSADIFADDPRVLMMSTHQSPLYPGTGAESERGANNLRNLTFAPGTGSAAYRARVSAELLPELDQFAPQLLLISAGFDAHRLDPLAGMNLDTDDYTWITRALVEIADRHALGGVVSLLEGGYSLSALKACTSAHLDGMA
jgi:acetoin utilization deacetylase AcuC-like enzyme